MLLANCEPCPPRRPPPYVWWLTLLPLALTQQASHTEIRKRYKLLAMRTHPDKAHLRVLAQGEEEQDFAEIARAYQVRYRDEPTQSIPPHTPPARDFSPRLVKTPARERHITF